MKEVPNDYRSEVFVAFDVETDGPCVAVNSMLSLGAVAYNIDKKLLSSFYINILPVPNGVQDPETMKWWGTQPRAWAALQDNRVAPSEAARQFDTWLSLVASNWGKIVPIASPLAFDSMWVNTYLYLHLGRSSLGWGGVDLQSFVSGYRKTPWTRSGSTYYPKQWFDEDKPHTHIANEDAKSAGATFVNILRSSLGLRSIK